MRGHLARSGPSPASLSSPDSAGTLRCSRIPEPGAEGLLPEVPVGSCSPACFPAAPDPEQGGGGAPPWVWPAASGISRAGTGSLSHWETQDHQ